jgi:hypothetical protein
MVQTYSWTPEGGKGEEEGGKERKEGELDER